MQLKEYKEAMDELQMPEDMDQRLKQRLEQQQEVKQMNKKNVYKKIAITAAVAGTVVGIGVANPAIVSNAAEAIARFFSYDITLKDHDGNKETVEMNNEYLHLREDAPTKDCKMSSVKEVGEALGIELLESKERYAYEGCISYSPSMSEEKALCGALISDKMYATGDLQNVKIDKADSEDSNDSIAFQKGEDYQSPIAMQISVRSDENLGEKYKDNELGYISDCQHVDMENISNEAEVYEIPDLDVKAVLFTVYTDGPIAWGIDEGELKCTTALFVYKGVEYVYTGAVSHETMKQFLNTLE